MSDEWTWTREVWSRHYQPLGDAGYQLDRVDVATYWKTHEAELREHFPEEVFIDTSALRTEAARAGQKRLAETAGGQRLVDCCIVRDGDRVVATFCGEQKSPDVYRQWHTNVHPDYRRRGIYNHILRGMIGYTGELGFDKITSEHAPGNNIVLIAKLRAGFRITGMEIDPVVGLSVVLTYFHNPDHLAAYDFRCGLATINDRLVAAGAGAMDQLITQLGGKPREG